MRLLWISNILFPAPCKELGIPSPVVGGWMYSSAKVLLEQDATIDLAVATVYSGKSLKELFIDNITYYLLPLNGDKTRYHKGLEPEWQKVITKFHPDLVHIHGSEFAHSLAFLNSCPQVPAVVSIQGLVSVCANYYYSGLNSREIIQHITFRDLVKLDTIWQQQKKFKQRGEIELEILKRVQHVIGRTSWDQAHTWAINPKAQYHFCNETLRPEFYNRKWSYDTCQKHSIFLSQAGYPIKGLHQVLKALPLVIKEYPDTKVYIGGINITSEVVGRLRISGYGDYIQSLIKKHNLSKHIIFTGPLNAEQICAQYLSANVFICPSSIENSPNSLGEAQLLGVPCIASDVGGVTDMIPNKECGIIYRFEEVELLAKHICEIFKTSVIFDNSEMQRISHDRHDKVINAKTLINIYKSIII